MNTEMLINQSVLMLKNGYSQSQIRDEVYRFVFMATIPNITINAAIDRCMELYGEIIRRFDKLDNY